MPRIGVTGHVILADGTAELVSASLAEHLRPYAGPGLHGVTCLANGADQLFARQILALNGTYEAVIPAADYRQCAVEQENRAAFDELVELASRVDYMPYDRSDRQAYMAASEELLDRCEMLFAVWDGLPSAGIGDTADVVRAARERGMPVTILWPAGAKRG